VSPAVVVQEASVRRPDGELGRLLDEHRVDLTAHCYRMLASPFEAEDAVQETMLRAGRATRLPRPVGDADVAAPHRDERLPRHSLEAALSASDGPRSRASRSKRISRRSSK
jgi:DNA-directed RNA polymerase specialized sigma24 family protein